MEGIEAMDQASSSRPRKRRLRFGLRGLLILVLVLGLVFGWLARMRRQARDQERFIAELARDRIIVNHPEPTYLCLFLMKVLSTESRATEVRCSGWLGPGWFSRPRGFNAGRLRDEQVPRVVERLGRLGTV